MIRTEGWTGYEVVKNAWASIPVDCAEILDDEYDDALHPNEHRQSNRPGRNKD